MPDNSSSSYNLDWLKYGVLELQSFLAKNNLSIEGNKTELIKRLCHNGIDMSSVAPWKPSIFGGKFNFGYNFFHSLRMVIINPIAEDKFQDADFVLWCEKAKWFKLHKSRDGPCEAVLYFTGIQPGDDAYKALKHSIEDQYTKVYHPNFEIWGCHPQQYWRLLPTLTSLRVNPLTYEELTVQRKKHYDKRKHVLVENVPQDVTDEELNKIVPQAKDVIVFNYDPEALGLALLEFDDEEAAEKFQASRKFIMVKSERCPTSLYWPRLQSWYEGFNVSGGTKKQLEIQCELTDRERIQKCQIWHVLQEDKREIISRLDLSAVEKLKEHVRLHEEQRPIKAYILADTKRRFQAHLDIEEDASHIIHTVHELVKKSDDVKPVQHPKDRKYNTGETEKAERIKKQREKEVKRRQEEEAMRQPERPINTVSRYQNNSPKITLLDFIPPSLAFEIGYEPNAILNTHQNAMAGSQFGNNLLNGPMGGVQTLLAGGQSQQNQQQASITLPKPRVIDTSKPLDKLDAFRAGIKYGEQPKSEVSKSSAPNITNLEDKLDAFRKGQI